MALLTIGTAATTTLQGRQFSSDPNALSNADFAAIANGIFRDSGQMTGGPFGSTPQGDGTGNKAAQIYPGAYTRSGILFLPLRGDNAPIQVLPGDWVCTDLNGNVFIIPQRALPKTLTLTAAVNSGSPIVTVTTSAIAAGWQNGTPISGANIPSRSIVALMAANGLSFSLASAATGLLVNATGSSASETITGGTFTHS